MKKAIKIFIVFCMLVSFGGLACLLIPGVGGIKPVLAAVNNISLYITGLRLKEAGARQSQAHKEVLIPLLIEAVKEDDIEKARAVLARGAGANALENATSNTPLFAAIDNSNPEMVALLLDYGANTYQITEEGHMPIHRAIREDELGEDENFKGIEIIRLLLEKGADINLRDLNGSTPLMCACKSFKPGLAAWLIENGADIYAVDAAGRNALEISTQSGSLDCAELLINIMQEQNPVAIP